MSYTNLSIRINAEIKAQAEKILQELGLSLSTAVNIFLRQTIRERGIPFELKLKDKDIADSDALVIENSFDISALPNNK